MNKKIKLNVPFFVILGAMNGAFVSLIASFFLDYMVTSYSTMCTLTYLDWLIICAPSFALLGALFNLASAIFLYEEEKETTTKTKKKK